jgi:hypothetical protein
MLQLKYPIHIIWQLKLIWYAIAIIPYQAFGVPVPFLSVSSSKVRTTFYIIQQYLGPQVSPSKTAVNYKLFRPSFVGNWTHILRFIQPLHTDTLNCQFFIKGQILNLIRDAVGSLMIIMVGVWILLIWKVTESTRIASTVLYPFHNYLVLFVSAETKSRTQRTKNSLLLSVRDICKS